MILRRLGNKQMLSEKIVAHFPDHDSFDTYIEPFFGAGGLFFNKKLSPNNILNDLDLELFNFWTVVKERPEDLKEFFLQVPYHQKVLSYWLKNKEEDSVKQAARFLYLSNNMFFGKGTTLRLNANKNNFNLTFPDNVKLCSEILSSCQFAHSDFRKFLKSISFSDNGHKNAFIYADPPYLGTDDNYSHSFKPDDFKDLIEGLIATKCRFAISEFFTDTIVDFAKEYQLHVHKVADRHNIRKTQTEVLLTNYRKHIFKTQKLF